MEKNFTMTVILQASPKDIYEAWMSSEGHSEMTGSPAVVDDKVGGKYSAWETYIFGKTLELVPFERILIATDGSPAAVCSPGDRSPGSEPPDP